MAGRIQYELGFKNDSNSFEKIKQELKSIQQMTQAEYLDLNKGLNAAQAAHQLKEIREEAKKLQNVLEDSFNHDIGSLNINKLNQGLKQSNINIQEIGVKFATLGTIGDRAFRNLISQVSSTNLQLKKTHSILEEMKTTMSNTIKWGIASSAMNNLTGSVQRAYSFVKGLDSSLNDIRIVTGKSADEMDRFAVQANKAAKNLGASTRDYTDAALIYYQQGLNEQDTAARTDVTVKTANVTKQSADKVSEQLTAIWNGYKVESQEAELYIDKVAKVAATTAADLEELSTGMSKVASAASTMGVDFDDLNAMLATVISVTRESPETIGTSFKNIFARMSQLQTSGEDDEGVQLTKVTKQMQDLGIEILDQDGKLKNMSTTIHEVAGKWNEWSTAQQVAAARVMAGTQQYSRFMALMNNQDMWESALEDSKTAQGELSKQNDIYLDSVEAHLNKLQASLEGVYDSLFDTEGFKDVLDILTFLVDRIDNFVDAIGGAKGALSLLGTIGINVFGKQMASGINTTITNLKNMRENTQKVKDQLDFLRNLKSDNYDNDNSDQVAEKMKSARESARELYLKKFISEDELKAIDQMTEKLQKAKEEMEDIEASQKRAAENYEKIFGEGLDFEEINDESKINKKTLAGEYQQEIDKEISKDNYNKQNIESFSKQADNLLNFDSSANYQEALEESKKAIDKVKDAEERLNKARAKDNTKEIAKAERDLAKATQDSEKKQNNLSDIENKRQKILDKLKSKYKEVIDATEEMSEQGFLEEGFRNKLEDDLEALENSFEESMSNPGWVQTFKMNAEELKDAYGEAADVIIQELQNIKEEVGDASTGELPKAEKEYQDSEQELGDTTEGVLNEEKIKGYLDLLGAVTSLVSIFQTLTSVISIWGDETASVGDKIGTTFMGILTIGGLVLNLCATVPTALAAIGISASVAGGMVSVSMKKATGDVIMFKLSLWEIFLILTAVAAVVAAVIGVVVLLSNAWNADANAAKKAAENAKALAEAADEARQKADDLRSAFEKYDEVYQTLQDCTKGTEEWKEALEKVDKQATEILKKYPDLLKNKDLWTTDEQGNTILDPEILEQQVKQSEQIADAANQAAQMGQITAERAQAKSDLTDAKRSAWWTVSAIDAGSLDDIADTIISNTDILEGLDSEGWKEKVQELTDCTELTAKEMLKYRDLLEKNNQTEEDSKKAEKNIAIEAAKTTLGKDASADKVNIGANLYTKEYKRLLNELTDKNEKISRTDEKDNENVRKMWERYQKASGTNYKLSDNAVQNGDNDRVFEYIDDNGDKQKIDFEQMKTTIATFEASNKNNSEAINKALNIVTDKINANNDKEVAAGLKDWLSTQNFESMGKEDFNRMTENIDTKNPFAIWAGTDNIAELFGGEDNLKEVADAMGISVTKLKQQIMDSVKDYQTALEEVGNNLSETAKGIFKDLQQTEGFKNLSVSTQEDIAKQIQEAFNTGGTAGAKQLAETFKKVDNIENFQKAIKNIDWKTTNLDDFKKNLADAGVTTSMTDDELNSYIEAMRKTQSTLTSLTEAQNRYNSAVNAIEKVQKGEDLDPEKDYAGLSDNLKKFFVQTSTGMYTLIGSAEEFVEAAKTDKIQGFVDKVNELTEQKDKLEKLQGLDYNNLSQDKTNSGGEGKYNKTEVTQQLDFLDYAGYDATKLAEWRKSIEEDGSIKVSELQNIANAVKENSTKFDEISTKLQENQEEQNKTKLSIALSAEDVDELNQLLEENKIGAEQYTTAWKKMKSTLDEDVDATEFKEMAKYLKDNADKVDGLDDSLKDNAKETKDVAEAILRYDSALEKTIEHYDDWDKALKAGTAQEQADTIKELKNVYSDLLDVDPENFSEGFLKNTDNLKLLQQAADGSVDAYNQLQRLAGQDILMQLGIDTAQFDYDKQYIEDSIYTLTGQDFDDLEVGAALNDENFLQGLTDMVNNAGMAADEATDYLANMGVDAEVETVEKKENEKHEYVGAQADVTTEEVQGVDPITGNPMNYTFPSVKYTPMKTEDTGEKEEKAFALKVTSANKSSGGNFKFKNSAHGAGNAGKQAREKRDKGGGGGSQKKPKKQDPIKNESDRYHDINIKLKQIETSLNRLQKSKDRLFGGALVKNLNKQLQVLNQQIDASNTKIKIAKGEVGELQGKLGSQGVSFNADGTIANYQSAYKAQLDAYNALVNQYNSLGVDAQEKWDEDETLKKAKEKFDDFVKDMQNYDTLITETIPDLEDQISEALYQKITIKLEAFDVAANIRLDLAQAKKDWEEFEKYVMKRIRDDDIFDQMKYSVGHDLSTYFNDKNTGKVQTAQKQVDFYKNRLSGIDPDKDPEEFKATLEKLEEWNQTLQEGLQEYQEAIDNIRQMELDFLDQVNEELEKQLSLYDQIESMVERDLDVFQQAFGDKASQAALDYLDKQLDVIEQRQSFLEEDVDIWKTETENAKARMETAKTNMETYAQLYGKESEQYLNAKDEFKHATEVYEISNEKYIDALDKTAENVASKLDKLSQKMTMQVDIDLEGMERSLLGGKTLDEAEKEWEMANKQAELYLDSINAIYGVQKLQRKYQTAIDNTSSITAQRKLNAIMEDEIKLLEDKDKLTQYDLDRANKKYEIALKQMELEDQMDNKSTMRLQRDQQGNYEYQFVADQDQISTLEEELSDLKNELYNLDLDEWNASMERMRDFTREMIEDMRDIALDANLTVDEKNALLEERYEQYQELMTSAAQIGETARTNLVQSSFIEICDFYNNDNEVFQNNLGQKFQGMEEWVLKSNEQMSTFTGEETAAWDTMMGANMAGLDGLYEHMSTKIMPSMFTTWSTTLGQMSTELAKEDGFIVLTRTSFEGLTKTVTDYGNAIQETFEKYEEWSRRAQYAAQQTADENRNVTSTLREQVTDINNLSMALNAQVKEWENIAAKAKASTQETYNYIKALKELEAAKAEAEANEIRRREEEERRQQQQNQQSSQPAAAPSNSGGGGTMYTVKSGDTLTGIAAMRGNVGRWREILNANAWIDDDSRAKALRKQYGTSDGHWIFPGQQLVLPFETGGYTGDWGDPNGRIAMLHQKELVLNKEDTKNFLDAIELIRNVNGKLTDSLIYELENIISGSLGSMMAMMSMGEDVLEQQVTIDAHFPNVTNSHEVEDAINNLINTASQRAGRNKD